MLEFLLCSVFTILPDYLFRRYAQGKRLGREINFFSVWFELRWGITACLILTISLITVIFYYHPSTSNAGSIFRTVSILPQKGGRVSEVMVTLGQEVEAGAPIFRLEDSSERTAVETAKRRIAEVEASMVVAKSELAKAQGTLTEARAAYAGTKDEYDRKIVLYNEGSAAVTEREVERLTILLEQRQGGIDAAQAGLNAVQSQIDTLLPAQKASAEASLAQAQAELDKMLVVAGVAGRVEQFTLRVGDFVSPVLRPAGILVPRDAGQDSILAGFGQIGAQVIRTGMLVEINCVSKPFTVIPMVVTEVQDVIAGGQFRPTDQLIDLQDRAPPGTLTVFLEPLYAGQTDDLPRGSRCIANAYSNFHDEIASGNLSTGSWLFYHMVDTVGIVHAVLLRIQALVLPVQTLVFSGH